MKKVNKLTSLNKGGKIVSLGLVLLFNLCVLSFTSYAQSLSADAGPNVPVCPNDSTRIGGAPSASGGTPPYTYSWSPASGLDDPTAANPNAFPASPIPYTLTVTDGAGDVATSAVTVTPVGSPTVSAGEDQIITQGTTAFLQASGAVKYLWNPATDLTKRDSVITNADPETTTEYCVIGTDENGCSNSDCMTIEVIPSDTVVIYNAFSPNGDDVNDVLFIGNIQKFPDNKLEIFNRNGKLVYQSAPYKNDWKGKVDGADLPCATYYVVFSKGNGLGKVTGSVTIIR